ncbi:hypothetical protein HZS61_006369 [Fusarium oxysporum f. sp. conglutinans]|uniref:HTH CENPB-type domain-containing protein n=1 Tax=Fusarium oxysporum f. sp. conglutinans TaxID=100902 RepID=A0A8H6LCF9_FUSOX|nr:hypothetical protein HZS61_006369 [Fusarium oxysporum f. sp. conglutinans]
MAADDSYTAADERARAARRAGLQAKKDEQPANTARSYAAKQRDWPDGELVTPDKLAAWLKEDILLRRVAPPQKKPRARGKGKGKGKAIQLRRQLEQEQLEAAALAEAESLAEALEVPLAEAAKLLADDREGYVPPTALAPAAADLAEGSLLTRGTIDAYIAAVIELWRLQVAHGNANTENPRGAAGGGGPPLVDDPNIEGKILLALQALQNDPKLKLRRAAEIYKVGRMILWRRQKGIQSRSDWVPTSRKLSDLEEQIIVQFILDLDSRGFPPRLRGVEEMANRLLADRNASPVGKRWASNFVRRHKELKTRFFRKYDYRRAKCEDPTAIRNWFRLVENTIAKYGIRLDEIYNFDETGFLMGMIASGMVVTGADRRGRPKSVQPGNREWITVIQAINAEGQAIPPFIIGAGQYHLANWYRESNLPGNWAIATSENGWTDNETGLEWLKHFDRCTAKGSKNRYRLLILDGHESHHSVDFERYCKANKIITLLFLIFEG